MPAPPAGIGDACLRRQLSMTRAFAASWSFVTRALPVQGCALGDLHVSTNLVLTTSPVAFDCCGFLERMRLTFFSLLCLRARVIALAYDCDPRSGQDRPGSIVCDLGKRQAAFLGSIVVGWIVVFVGWILESVAGMQSMPFSF